MTTRQLGLVRKALAGAGMEISYAYEDLVFLEQNDFLLQFTDNDQEVLVHTNCDAVEDELADAIALLQRKAKQICLTVLMGKRYRLSQDNDEETIRMELF